MKYYALVMRIVKQYDIDLKSVLLYTHIAYRQLKGGHSVIDPELDDTETQQLFLLTLELLNSSRLEGLALRGPERGCPGNAFRPGEIRNERRKMDKISLSTPTSQGVPGRK